MQNRLAVFGLLVLLLASSPVNAGPPVKPCFIDLPQIYLVVDHARRHIADWDTYLSLGFTQADVVPCGADANAPEGAPITRLLKGSSEKVYWMDNGARRHIPNMDTFTALGFRVDDITVLPDDVPAWWPEGTPLPAISPPPAPFQPWIIGRYTVQIHPPEGLIGYATISAPGMATVRIAAVESLGALPVANITGDGYPSVMFLTRSTVGSHCCWGTTVYQLGPTPVKILELTDTAYYYGATGRGEFKDLNGDGVYEFVTRDALTIANSEFPCSQPSVQVVLEYNQPQHRYLGASPRFASSYVGALEQLSEQANKPDAQWCDIQPLIVTLLYLGRVDEARTRFKAQYEGSDSAFWTALTRTVEQGRSFVPGAASAG